MSFSQSTKLLYTGMGYVGASHSLNEGSNGLRPPGEYMTGAVVAVDVATNTVRWKKQMPYSLAHGNGILTTSSDLLFIGQPDGNLLALDARTGHEVWRFQTGAAISAARSPTRSKASNTSRSWRKAPAFRTAPAPPRACRSATA
jgi:outer membrane protein assembly factor BamB